MAETSYDSWPGVNLTKPFWGKFTYSPVKARSFHSNATNIADVYKMG
jgi:hypothetical protein